MINVYKHQIVTQYVQMLIPMESYENICFLRISSFFFPTSINFCRILSVKNLEPNTPKWCVVYVLVLPKRCISRIIFLTRFMVFTFIYAFKNRFYTSRSFIGYCMINCLLLSVRPRKSYFTNSTCVSSSSGASKSTGSDMLITGL